MTRKIFLSCPMKGRKEFDIKQTLEKMKKVILDMYPDDNIEFYDNFESGRKLTGSPAVNNAKHPELKYLGMAISKMADCDTIAVIDSPLAYKLNSNGCYIESEVAFRYYGQTGHYDRNTTTIRLGDPDGKVYLNDLVENEKSDPRFSDYRKELIEKVRSLIKHGYSIDEAAEILNIKPSLIESSWSDEIDEECCSEDAEYMDR